MTPKITFDLPKSIEGAETRRLELIAQITNIDMQLSDRNRTNTAGRLGPKEYWSRRTKTIGARGHKSAELQFLKLWIKKELQIRAASIANIVNTPTGLLAAADRLIRRLQAEIPFDPTEVAVAEAISGFILLS